MDSPQSQSYTLIVRLWREQISPTTQVWRGTLQCLQTRETIHFQSLFTLATQIARILDTFEEECD